MKHPYTPLRGAAFVALLVGLNPLVRADDSQTQPSPFRDRQHGNTPSVPANGSDNVQATSPDSSRWQGQSSTSSSHAMAVPVALRRSSAKELTGLQVRNRGGESLGKVKDFIVDANSGQVVYAVVGAGGVAGIGESLHAVPVSALQYDSSSGQERLTLDVDSARWSQAPKFRKNDIASLQADRDGRTTYQFYGQSWPQQSVSASAQSGRQGQSLIMSSDLIGKDVKSGGQDVGEIEDVLVQLQNRSAAVVLDADASFAGQDQKYIVPLSRISLGGTDSISTTLARSDFSGAQQLQGDSWASSGQQGNARIYVWPAAGSSASISSEHGMNNVAQSEPVIPSGRKSDDVRLSQQDSANGSVSVSNPNPSTSRSNTEVAQIREALQNDAALSQKGARDVQVVAQGDKLVLLGTVKTKETKDQIEERVERLAPNRSVDNQIRVATAEE